VKRTAVIFDMDGTLANVSSIRHLVKPNSERHWKDFHAFHRESVNVPAHAHVVNHAQTAHMLGHDVVIVTARSQMWARHTAMWLALNGVPSSAMFMRANGDHRADVLVKADILEAISHTWDVVHAVDDNPSIIALWQSKGIPVTVVEGWES
jgi:phosphoserine phosphatase